LDSERCGGRRERWRDDSEEVINKILMWGRLMGKKIVKEWELHGGGGHRSSWCRRWRLFAVDCEVEVRIDLQRPEAALGMGMGLLN
jgi:hypothetical protein